MSTPSITSLKKLQKKMSTPVPVSDDHDEKDVRANTVMFLSNLVDATPQNSKLAYLICNALEKGMLELPELNQVFPEAKTKHRQVKKKASEREEGLKDQIAELESEIAGMKRDKKELGKSKASKKEIAIVAEEIESFEEDLEACRASLEDLKGPDAYKPFYTVEREKNGEGVVSDKDWSILKKWLAKEVKKSKASDADGLYGNLKLLCDHLGFGQTEKDFLRLLVSVSESSELGGFIDTLGNKKQKNTLEVMARMLGISRPQLSAMILPDAQLSEKGMLLQHDDDYSYDADDSAMPFLPDYIQRVLREPDLTIDVISRRLVGEPVTTELDWDRDFSHLGERGQQMIAMLESAKTGKVKGINMLLYGLPDTGKTEAVKAAAKKVGLDLYMVGEKAGDGIGEPDREDRMQSALLAQALLADKKNAAVLFDEMDDLLPGASARSRDQEKPTGNSKVFLNRLLERNKTITFWTANDPEKFHPAVLRRMRYSMEFDIPPVSVRERMWGSISARHNFNISAEDCRKFGQNYIAPPGMIDTAVRNAVLAGGVTSIPISLAASATLLFGNQDSIIVRDTVPSNYDPRLLVAKLEDSDLNLEELGGHIKSSGNGEFSMLLYGPPGTGKSAYAAYLAKSLGMEAMIVKASDILDKYVGGNEQNIANIFKKAREEKLFLIIDEGDTFLRRRDQAAQNWEVSTVNEMLTQIENHKFPIAMTTNLFADIDPAAKRRFLFKIKCDYMSNAQSQLAFGTFFNREAPASLTDGTRFTPADFALIRRQMKVMAPDVTSERIVQLLKIEAATRTEKPTNYDGNPRFGFGTGSTVTQLRPA